MAIFAATGVMWTTLLVALYVANQYFRVFPEIDTKNTTSNGQLTKYLKLH